MSEWIGHTLVALIVGSIMLSTSLTRTRADELVVATMQLRASKKMTLDVAAALERDIRNVGSNFPTYDLEPDSAVMAWATDSTDNFFQFVGQPAPGQPPAPIRYEWHVADSALVNGEMKPLYQISRYVGGTLTQQSAAMFTAVSIQIQDDLGQPPASPDEVRQIAVALRSISSLGSSDTLPETRWNAVYRPKALSRQDSEDV